MARPARAGEHGKCARDVARWTHPQAGPPEPGGAHWRASMGNVLGMWRDGRFHRPARRGTLAGHTGGPHWRACHEKYAGAIAADDPQAAAAAGIATAITRKVYPLYRLTGEKATSSPRHDSESVRFLWISQRGCADSTKGRLRLRPGPTFRTTRKTHTTVVQHT